MRVKIVWKIQLIFWHLKMTFLMKISNFSFLNCWPNFQEPSFNDKSWDFEILFFWEKKKLKHFLLYNYADFIKSYMNCEKKCKVKQRLQSVMSNVKIQKLYNGTWWLIWDCSGIKLFFKKKLSGIRINSLIFLKKVFFNYWKDV